MRCNFVFPSCDSPTKGLIAKRNDARYEAPTHRDQITDNCAASRIHFLQCAKTVNANLIATVKPPHLANRTAVTYLASFLEGIITFISPRLLPMLPIYLAYFAGGERLDSGATKS